MPPNAEARFASQLESERLDSAERRHHVESELAGARDAMLNMQDELTSARANALRTIERLEADLDTTRAMLAHASDSLRGEREAAAAMRDELRTQLASVDWDRQRAEIELQDVRREMAEKIASTQPFIATMREQYLLAAAERDAMVKELTMQRQRAEENARIIEQTRSEFAIALDEEHRAAMELLDRAWSYVQGYPRIPDAWPRPEARAGIGTRRRATAIGTPHGVGDANRGRAIGRPFTRSRIRVVASHRSLRLRHRGGARGRDCRGSRRAQLRAEPKGTQANRHGESRE